jgi:hypothetical protein
MFRPDSERLYAVFAAVWMATRVAIFAVLAVHLVPLKRRSPAIGNALPNDNHYIPHAALRPVNQAMENINHISEYRDKAQRIQNKAIRLFNNPTITR